MSMKASMSFEDSQGNSTYLFTFIYKDDDDVSFGVHPALIDYAKDNGVAKTLDDVIDMLEGMSHSIAKNYDDIYNTLSEGIREIEQ